ncbi:hypothetical protein [Halalkalibacter sp. APA_J-10(15)]|uniref:hypothetical protein n=1 Tax=Halalkalibacter sp. APA_J-10(15) TaxID=2933805 RepID=UPI001FF51688|nr:hypothetical protein [Halalkalibacter sp. APA_J-10(15)]MCK0470114.1 hypothetical protein [Halalkalibacter sp. APA_J-10(15)]
MKRVLVVCSGGLGTSLILKIELEKLFNEWDVLVYIEQSDVSAVGFSEAEIIIGAKQIIESIAPLPNVEMIPLAHIADTTHIRQSLLENKVITSWVENK